MSGRLVSASSALLCLFLCVFRRVLVLAVPEQFADERGDCGNDEDDEGAFSTLEGELEIGEEEKGERVLTAIVAVLKVVKLGS
jgi:hypothetical protein